MSTNKGKFRVLNTQILLNYKCVNLSIGVHTERCSICRRWSSVRLPIESESAWNMPEDAHTLDRFQQWNPRFPRLQLHPEHHPPLLTSGIFCYLPFVWCCVHTDRCCTQTSCTFVLLRRLKRFRRLDRKEACWWIFLLSATNYIHGVNTALLHWANK